MQEVDLELRGDYIELDKLLKASGLADSGGQARALIVAGEVRVDGQVELRKTAKMRAGQVVEFAGQRVSVRAAPGQGG
jgi:ribosome-associated protein